MNWNRFVVGALIAVACVTADGRAQQETGPVKPPVVTEGTPCCLPTDCGADCWQHAHLAAGVGVHCLKPHFGSNPAFNIFNNGVGAFSNLNSTNLEQNFEYDYSVSPIVWLGYASTAFRKSVGHAANGWPV